MTDEVAGTALTTGANADAADSSASTNVTSSQGKTDEGAASKATESGNDAGKGGTALTSKEAEAAKPIVPEVYEAFQLPDGVEIDAKAIELASPVFKELGLTQENAQKVVGLYTELTKQLDERIATQRAETIADWLKQAKADKEIGGAKWSKSLEQAQSIVNKYADAETRQFLEETGLGNHPGLIKMLAKAGANFSEGSFVAQGANGSSATKTLEQVFYPESAAGK